MCRNPVFDELYPALFLVQIHITFEMLVLTTTAAAAVPALSCTL
jgi:hypothetical protein